MVLEILEKILDFGIFSEILIFWKFWKLWVIISKVGSKFWRWEGYIGLKSQNATLECFKVCKLKTDKRAKDADSKSKFSTSKAFQVPQLEEWFEKNSHPCHAVVASYTESLNSQPYRFTRDVSLFLLLILQIFFSIVQKGGGGSNPYWKKYRFRKGTLT